MDFETIYRGYVIRELSSQFFIGLNSETYRVSLRKRAGKFTKEEAAEYIKSGALCKKGGPFVVEDAI